MAEATTKTTKKPRKSTKAASTKKAGTTKKAATKAKAEVVEETSGTQGRFSTALSEAKAGAAAYREQAKEKGGDLMADAQKYGEDAKQKAGELAVEGKAKASDAIASLGNVVGDTAGAIDEKFGEQYGDYARSASRTLQEASAKLEAKSVEELGEDAKEFVRKQPAVAVGIAAVAGFFLARLFRGGRD